MIENGKNMEIKGNFLISAICNGAFYGSGFNPAPEASLCDGLINLITAEKIPLYKLPFMILKYKKGKHRTSPHLNEYKISSGQISSDKDFLANIDGEIFTTNKIDFKLIPSAISWIYFDY